MRLDQPFARAAVRWAAIVLLASPAMPSVDIVSIQHATVAGGDGECYPSPLLGERVNTTGTITSVHRDSFTLQSAAAAWSGIAVHTGVGHPILREVNIGDDLHLSGVVTELDGMTALQNITDYEMISRGNTVGTVLISTGHLGTACNLGGEAYEGVLVSMENVNVEDDGSCDAITINDGSSATRLSFGAGTLLSSITGASISLPGPLSGLLSPSLS